MNQSNAPQKKEEGLSARTLLDNTRIRMLLSLGSAILMWFIVTMLVQPNTSQIINNVPVNFNYNALQYTQQGLSIVNNPEYTVSVIAYGDGYAIGNLQPDDFVVYPDYTSVKGSGEASLRLNVRCTASSTGNISVELQDRSTRVEVVFDTVAEIVLPVAVRNRDVSMADGYILNRTITTPAEITLHGPTSELARVKQVVAELSLRGDLNSNVETTVPLLFLDAEDEPIDFTYTMADFDAVDLELVVYKLAELPLRLNFINTPPGFDSSTLRYSLGQDTLLVAGPASVVTRLGELNIGTIDLSTFSLNKSYELAITLPSGVVSQEHIPTIGVNFDTTGLSTRTLNLPESCIEVVNLPTNYRLNVESKRIANVTLCGPQEALEGLTAASVVARIDMDAVSAVTGQQNLAVNIYVPSQPQVFALGSYTVQCKIEED